MPPHCFPALLELALHDATSAKYRS
jgi:hypothetical protein